MPFEKGHNLGKGRPKGSTNKDSELKIFIRSLLEDNTEKLKKEVEKLEGKTYIDSVLALLEYAVPKLSRTEVTADLTVTTEENLEGWSEEDLKIMSDLNKKNKNN